MLIYSFKDYKLTKLIARKESATIVLRHSS